MQPRPSTNVDFGESSASWLATLGWNGDIAGRSAGSDAAAGGRQFLYECRRCPGGRLSTLPALPERDLAGAHWLKAAGWLCQRTHPFPTDAILCRDEKGLGGGR